MSKTTPLLPAESAGDEEVAWASTSPNPHTKTASESSETKTASNSSETNATSKSSETNADSESSGKADSKLRPKIDRNYLKTLDSQALGAYFRAMSNEELEELFKTSNAPLHKGPSIPYDDSADFAYEQGKPLPTPDLSSDTTESRPPRLPQ
ncbi:hypothetical protein H112_01341 [Trichophyton rubrum D6]|uniref:Uncharacterized protein n=3 Tax=Trichophyton TaxID=5550 RepID=F2SWN9_TRIRC|nr:uncharacterized protein TERG_06988 [Trichophyton rubrum CBS 118892]EZF26462.1 hypothetical protein H100_01335 [Trichophyton rubrum MR850]EZF45435.1 hypothetical protein H102_01330 [Trichophyton rubrum CBS 100081]EZF56087.1 hypothetical protein H103_01339 [Trichophyton rubrum CBS 288.86]EZF66779.1 hypothetical protein H104_01320 [Trichophyton rubrum CBS 289.86]EZF77325.1 hypothetical protein H105_01349 [Trichophyton soudanense CBS 452.61]EZF88095.1 hypothetical protein H110_01338 [Trichophy